MDKIFRIEPFERFNNAIEDVLLNIYVSEQDSKTSLESHVLQAAKEDMKKLIEGCNWDLITISSQLQNKGWNEDKVHSLISLIEKNKSAVLYAKISHHNSKYGNVIHDFNWSLKLVRGTNDLKTLNYPLLQLQLIVHNSDGKLTQLLFDVNKEMLSKLIAVLENRCNKK